MGTTFVQINCRGCIKAKADLDLELVLDDYSFRLYRKRILVIAK